MPIDRTHRNRTWNFRIASIAVAVVALASAIVTPSLAVTSETFTREELRSDITQAYELLTSRHPNLDAHTSRADFDALYRRLLEEVEETNTVFDAYGLLTELTGAVCDEHTQVDMERGSISNRPVGWPWFEYPLIVADGKLYMQPKGHRIREEVLSIDALKGADIAAELAARFPSDGCLDDGTLFVNDYLSISGNIIAGMIGKKGPYVVKSKALSATQARTRLLDGIDLVGFNRDGRYARSLLSAKDTEGLRYLGFRQLYTGPEQKRAGLDYWYSQEIDMAYIRIDTFKVQDEAAEGIEKVMRDVIRRNPGALTINLIGNSGGSTQTAQLLMAFLLPRSHRLSESVHARVVSKTQPSNFAYFDDEAEKLQGEIVRLFSRLKQRRGLRSLPIAKKSFGKPDYKGQIYVLLDPRSRSSSIKVATNLKRLRNATIVGSVTATDTFTQCPRANGAFLLEHTQFSLLIPELCFRSPGNRFNDEATLMPDIAVSPIHTPLENLNTWTVKAAMDDFHEVETQ